MTNRHYVRLKGRSPGDFLVLYNYMINDICHEKANLNAIFNGLHCTSRKIYIYYCITYFFVTSECINLNAYNHRRGKDTQRNKFTKKIT